MSSASTSSVAPSDAVSLEPESPRPTSTTVLTSWQGERRYEIRRPGGPAVTIDASGETALGPVDTLLGALASCSAIDILGYLAKRRTPADRLEIRVDAERAATAPRRVLHARLTIEIEGNAIDTPHAERAIALSFQTYCSVSASLAPDLTIESRLVLNGVTHAPVVQRGSEVQA